MSIFSININIFLNSHYMFRPDDIMATTGSDEAISLVPGDGAAADSSAAFRCVMPPQVPPRACLPPLPRPLSPHLGRYSQTLPLLT